jgi:hypothetical protein
MRLQRRDEPVKHAPNPVNPLLDPGPIGWRTELQSFGHFELNIDLPL